MLFSDTIPLSPLNERQKWVPEQKYEQLQISIELPAEIPLEDTEKEQPKEERGVVIFDVF